MSSIALRIFIKILAVFFFDTEFNGIGKSKCTVLWCLSIFLFFSRKHKSLRLTLCILLFTVRMRWWSLVWRTQASSRDNYSVTPNKSFGFCCVLPLNPVDATYCNSIGAR